jgi:hypothetical protein
MLLNGFKLIWEIRANKLLAYFILSSFAAFAGEGSIGHFRTVDIVGREIAQDGRFLSASLATPGPLAAVHRPADVSTTLPRTAVT